MWAALLLVFLGFVGEAAGATNYCNSTSSGCSRPASCMHLMQTYTDATDGWFWLQTPGYSSRPYVAQCMRKGTFIYQMLQQTDWRWTGDSSALYTTSTSKLSNSVLGRPGRAFRLPTKIWHELSKTYDMRHYLWQLSPQSTAKVACGTNEYTGTIDFRLTSYFRAYNIKPKQGKSYLLWNYNGATARNAFPRGPNRKCGWSPFFYVRCCYLCPSYGGPRGGGYWKDDAHPMTYVKLAQVRDANGKTMFQTCAAARKTFYRSPYSKGYYGLAMTKLWLGGDGGCVPLTTPTGGSMKCTVTNGRQVCSFTCGTGWTKQGPSTLSCVAGQWKPTPASATQTPLCLPKNYYCNSTARGCILLQDCEHIKHYYPVAINGLYWFTDPITKKPYQAWCSFNGKIGYQLLQVTEWNFAGNTQLLDTKTQSRAYNNFAGKLTQAHRQPMRIWNSLGKTHKYFMWKFWMRMSDGSRCQTPLMYGGNVRITASASGARLYGIKENNAKQGNLQLLNYAKGNAPAGAWPDGNGRRHNCYSSQHGRVPWWYQQCCWVCPSYEHKTAYWYPARPMIYVSGFSKIKDMNGNTAISACQKGGKTIARSKNKSYFGVDRMEFWYGASDRCSQPKPVRGGKWQCKSVVNSGQTCALKCGDGWANSNGVVPKCVAGAWTGGALPTCINSGAYCNNTASKTCKILPNCLAIWHLLQKDKSQTGTSGYYWIKGPDGKNYLTYCVFTTQDSRAMAYTLLQRTEYSWSGNTAALATDKTTFYNKMAGNIRQAYRLPGSAWNSIAKSNRGFMWIVYLRTPSGKLCTPLNYTGSQAMKITVQSQTISNLKNDQTQAPTLNVPMWFGTKFGGTSGYSVFGSQAKGISSTSIPFFWATTTTPDVLTAGVKGSDSTPHPYIAVSSLQNLPDAKQQSTNSIQCPGNAPPQKDSTGKFYAVGRLELYIGGSDRCPPPPTPKNGKYACSGFVAAGQGCALSCNNGYAVQGTAPTCIAGRWWPAPQTCQQEQPLKFDCTCKCQEKYADKITPYGPRCSHPGGSEMTGSFTDDGLTSVDFDFEFGKNKWDRNEYNLWTLNGKWKCILKRVKKP